MLLLKLGLKHLLWIGLRSLLLVSLVSACGHEVESARFAQDINGSTNVNSGSQNLRNVTLSAANQAIEPSNIPPSNSGLRTIKFRSSVTIKPLTSTNPFAYANTNWGIRFFRVSDVNSQRTFQVKDIEKKLKVISDGFVPSGSNITISDVTTATMEFQIDLDENDWGLIYPLASTPQDSFRLQISVQLFYNIRDTISTSDTDGYAQLEATQMQNDVGVLLNPASLSVVGSSSGEITIEFGGPELTDAELPSAGYQPVGKSILSGYRLMYWKDGDCSDSNWIFESHPLYRTNPSLPDPTLSCSFGDYASRIGLEGACSLGCSQTNSQDYHLRNGVSPTDEEVAVPLESGACYKVANVPGGRKTFALTGLENNATYYMIAWPVDSSGALGSKRSTCSQGVPLKVPLAASNDAKESVQDCFIATAASGSSSSLTVHYWRVLRDRWFDQMGLSTVYYRFAPQLADWLRGQPELMPSVNFVLLYSGKFFVALDRSFLSVSEELALAYAKLSVRAKTFWNSFVDSVSKRWAEAGVARATEAIEGAEGTEKVVPAEQNAAQSINKYDDLPASKALRDSDAIEKDAAAEKPRKALNAFENVSDEDSSSAEKDSEKQEKPIKALPSTPYLDENGQATDRPDQRNAENIPTKTLPEASNEPMSHSEKESSRFPEGSVFSTVRFGGGTFLPEEQSLYTVYYPNRKPVRLTFQQTFRLFDAGGEFNLGVLGSYQSLSGTVPRQLQDGSQTNEALIGKKINYYTLGLYAAVDYRLRYTKLPPVTPRFMLNLGFERLRETPSAVRTGSDGKPLGKVGYTLWKPMIQAGVGLEFSFGALLGKGFQGSVLAYGARDLLLSFDGLLSVDLSGHQFSQSGIMAQAALVLLVE